MRLLSAAADSGDSSLAGSGGEALVALCDLFVYAGMLSVMRCLSWAVGGGWSAAGTEESSGGVKRPDNPKVKRQQTIDEDYDC